MKLFGLAVPVPEPLRLAEVSERFLRPPYDELKDAMSSKEDFRTLVNEAVTAHNVGESEKAVRELDWVTHVVNEIDFTPADPTGNDIRQETLSILRKASSYGPPCSRSRRDRPSSS